MKLLPLFIFWCLWFVNFSTRTVLSPILPLIEDDFSLSHGEAGGLFTTLSFGYSIALMGVGRYAPVWGYKRTVVVGFVGVGVIFLGLQFTESYTIVLILLFLLGIVTGTYFPSIIPIITETYDQKHWGKVLGFHDSAASLSIFSVPILVSFGLHFLSWKRIFLLLGMISLLLPMYFWMFAVEPKQDKSWQKSRYVDLLKKKRIWVMSFLYVFGVSSTLGIYSILPLYLIKERGIELHFANIFFGISRIGGLFASVLGGFCADRYGYHRMLVVSLFAGGLSIIAFSIFSKLLLIGIGLILQATLGTVFFVVAQATVSELTCISERSMAIGFIVSVGVIFGMGVTPFLLGVIADSLDFRTGILCLGIVTTLSSSLVRFLKEE